MLADTNNLRALFALLRLQANLALHASVHMGLQTQQNHLGACLLMQAACLARPYEHYNIMELSCRTCAVNYCGLGGGVEPIKSISEVFINQSF